MSIKKIFTWVALLFLSGGAYIGVEQGCEILSHGFRFHRLLSNLPNHPSWEVPPLPQVDQNELCRLLEQPFTFLGSGGWCDAFLGADKQTVLKFYKHTHLDFLSLLTDFSWRKLLLHSPPHPEGKPFSQAFNFASCHLLYTRAKERTGLLYVHLNKTEGLLPRVTLIDPLGIRHTLELDKTEFLVQQRAELPLPRLQRLMKEGKVQAARESIREMISCLRELYSKGIRDDDPTFGKNYGYVGKRAIALDLSSFVEDPSLQERGDYTPEIRDKLKRIERTLKKYYPKLYRYYEECLRTQEL